MGRGKCAAGGRGGRKGGSVCDPDCVGVVGGRKYRGVGVKSVW